MFHVKHIKNQNGRGNRNKRLKNTMRVLTHKQEDMKIEIGRYRPTAGTMIKKLHGLEIELSFVIVVETRGIIHAQAYFFNGVKIKIQIDKCQFTEEFIKTEE